MLDVFKNLIHSEKAVVSGALLLGATALTALGKLPVDQWVDYTALIGSVYLGGKSIQGAGAAIGKKLEEGAKREIAETKRGLVENNRKIDDLVSKLPK